MTTKLGDKLPDIAGQPADMLRDPLSGSSLPSAVLRIPVSVQVVIGSARLPLSQVTRLVPGTLLTLDEKLGTPARMLVNGREVARGNLVVLDDDEGRLGLTITDVAGSTVDS